MKQFFEELAQIPEKVPFRGDFHRLAPVIVLGISIRLILAPFFAHPFDMYSFYESGEEVLHGNMSVFKFLVPPGYSYFLFAFPATAAFNLASGYLGNTSIPMSSLNPSLNPGAPWNITIVPGLLFDLLEKLPLIASDTLVAFLLYRLVLNFKGDEKMALSVAALWFLNPLTIWISSGWGMFDTLPTLFTVIAFYLALSGRLAFSGAALAAAISLKYYPVVLLFPLILIAWRLRGSKGAWTIGASAIISTSVFFTPSIVENIARLRSLAGAGGPSLSEVHSAGLSIWTVFDFSIPGFNNGIISSVLVLLALAASYIWLYKKRQSDDIIELAKYFAIPLLVLLLLYNFVGENYFDWLLPFASIITLSGAGPKKLYWLLTSLAFLSSIVDTYLPYYMLPVASWVGRYLVSAISAVTPYRVASSGSVATGFTLGKGVLSIFGVSCAGLLLVILYLWTKNTEVPIPTTLTKGSTA